MPIFYDEHHLNYQNNIDDLKKLMDLHVLNGGDITNISFEVISPQPIFGVKENDCGFWSKTEGCPYLRVLIFNDKNLPSSVKI